MPTIKFKAKGDEIEAFIRSKISPKFNSEIIVNNFLYLGTKKIVEDKISKPDHHTINSLLMGEIRMMLNAGISNVGLQSAPCNAGSHTWAEMRQHHDISTYQ